MKGLILFLGIFFTLLVIGLFWFVYINRADEKSTSFLFKIIVPILGAVALLLNDFLKTNLIDKKIVNVLFVTNRSTGQPIDMDFLTKRKAGYKTKGYSDYLDIWAYGDSSREKLSKSTESVEGKILDFVDAGFWGWYSKNFYSHWDVTRYNFEGINSKGTNDSTVLASLNDVSKFKLNQIFGKVEKGFLKYHYGEQHIFLPQKCTIKKIDSSKNTRAYKLNLREAEIEIKIIALSGGRVSGRDAISDLLIANIDSPDGLWESHFQFVFTTRYRRFYQWSPRTQRIEKWILDLTEEFNRQISWEIYREHVLKSI